MIEEDRPSGADAEHCQGAKTINHSGQKRLRAEKRRRLLANKFAEAEVTRKTILNILTKNKNVEDELANMTESGLVSDASIACFLELTVAKLKDFIHTRKFEGPVFKEASLSPPGVKINKTQFKTQTAESIENDCNSERPCYVWLAWKLRSSEVVLKAPPVPTLSTGLTLPEFTVVYAGAEDLKCPSNYLQNSTWVETLKATVKGVRFGNVDDDMIERSKKLLPAMQQRLHFHIEEFVHPTKYGHWTLDFVRDNLPAMAAIKCLIGQAVDRLEMFGVNECLLRYPGEILNEDVFFSISIAPNDSQLGSMEGDYLSYDTVRRKWIRSGKASGLGKDACFVGRNNTHARNARFTDQMR